MAVPDVVPVFPVSPDKAPMPNVLTSVFRRLINASRSKSSADLDPDLSSIRSIRSDLPRSPPAASRAPPAAAPAASRAIGPRIGSPT